MLLKTSRWVSIKNNYTRTIMSPLEVMQNVKISGCRYLMKRSVATTAKEESEEIADNEKSSYTFIPKHQKVPFDENSPTIPSHGEFSIYLKHKNIILHIDKPPENVSFYSPKSGQLVTFDKDFFAERTINSSGINDVIKEEDKHERLLESLTSYEESKWRKIKIDTSKLLTHYMMLSKIRLTGLVVLTSMAGYAMAPGVFDPVTFFLATVGTSLMSASANCTNQFIEVPYDSQMNRTKNRVLVKGNLTSFHALNFAVITGTLGMVTLTLGANPLTAGLGALNWFLYTMCYTPMKRLHLTNTWLGSIVGAIPPMMGWAACTGGLEAGAWLLGAILYAWQFPHFNALSWNLRPDYARSGYQMTSVINPNLCKRVAFRYCLGMIGLCGLAPVIDLTTWTFFFNSLPLNIYFSYLGWQFYRDGDSASSRRLFRFSLLHIPALLLLMLVSKKKYKHTLTRKHSKQEQPVTCL